MGFEFFSPVDLASLVPKLSVMRITHSPVIAALFGGLGLLITEHGSCRILMGPGVRDLCITLCKMSCIVHMAEVLSWTCTRLPKGLLYRIYTVNISDSTDLIGLGNLYSFLGDIRATAQRSQLVTGISIFHWYTEWHPVIWMEYKEFWKLRLWLFSGWGLWLSPLGQLGSVIIWLVLRKAFDILVLM